MSYDYLQSCEYLQCFGATPNNPSEREAVTRVNESADAWTKSMFISLRQRYAEAIYETSKRKFKAISSKLSYPPPYYKAAKSKQMKLLNKNSAQKIPTVDPELGDIPWKEQWFHDWYASKTYYSFNDGQHKDTWTSVQQAQEWFNFAIKDQIYEKFTKMKQSQGSSPEMLLDTYSKATIDPDTLISIIAFGGYGAHYTIPIAKTPHGAIYKNDTSWLQAYDVRKGYVRYGATAYFDKAHKVTMITIYDETGNTSAADDPESKEMPGNNNNNGPDEVNVGPLQPHNVRPSDGALWNHAKWVWKVSLTVATFLKDYVALLRFREVNAYVTSINRNLKASHPLRRMLLPFTTGSVQANRVYNEYLRKNGLFHRCFAFKFKALVTLIDDCMVKEYNFKLFKKKVSFMKTLPDEIFPLTNDVTEFWLSALNYMSRIFPYIYGDFDEPSKEQRERAIANNTENQLAVDSKLLDDKELKKCYEMLTEKLGIGSRYRFKRFNVIHLLAHFICISSVWNKHLSSSLSFEYSTDINFTGIKIRGNNSSQNDIQSYVQYCTVVLAKGRQFPSLMFEQWKGVIFAKKAWSKSKNVDASKLIQVFDAFLSELRAAENHIDQNNRKRRIPLYNVHPKYLQATITMM